MNSLDAFYGAYVDVEMSGGKRLIGYLIDYGLDLVAIQQFERVHYLPFVHVQNLSLYNQTDGESFKLQAPFQHPFQSDGTMNSVRKVLSCARGCFVEIYVSGNSTLHGYLTSVMNDYFIFHSPIYKTIFVALGHLKWVVPYQESVMPYALNPESIPYRSAPTSLPKSFNEQCKRLTGSLVIFDMGDHPDKVGRLNSVDTDRNLAELFTANGSRCLLNLHHIKTVCLP